MHLHYHNLSLIQRDDTSRPSSILADELEREESESELLLSPKTIDDDDSLTEEEKKEVQFSNTFERHVRDDTVFYVLFCCFVVCALVITAEEEKRSCARDPYNGASVCDVSSRRN